VKERTTGIIWHQLTEEIISKFGFYLSPADLHELKTPDGRYGNGSEAKSTEIPTPVKGEEHNRGRNFTYTLDDYSDLGDAPMAVCYHRFAQFVAESCRQERSKRLITSVPPLVLCGCSDMQTYGRQTQFEQA
jgi:hypothetical protein